MNKEQEFELIKVMAFVTLMQDMEGVAPSYAWEKWKWCRDGGPWETFSLLDSNNKLRLINWGKEWGIDIENMVVEARVDYREMPASEYRKKYGVRQKCETQK